jgi:hypothetical protein
MELWRPLSLELDVVARRSPHSAQELLSREQLRNFVDNKNNRYTRADATRLWNTITSNLPLHESCFCIYNGSDKPVSLQWYKQWLHEEAPRSPRHRNESERSKWKVGRAHIERFQEGAEHMTTSQISEYGPVARKLLADWLNS